MSQDNPCHTPHELPNCLPVVARITFKVLMLAFRATTGTAPPTIHRSKIQDTNKGENHLETLLTVKQYFAVSE